MRLSMIAAMDRNRLIGNRNQLPWHLPADFAHFKALTMGKPVLMGRKTFESIGRPLPGRRNIVLTRNADLHLEGVEILNSLSGLETHFDDSVELMVIGGSRLYRQLLPVAERLYLTEVDGEFDGDAWFPEYDPADWRVIDERLRPADEKHAYACRFLTLQRR